MKIPQIISALASIMVLFGESHVNAIECGIACKNNGCKTVNSKKLTEKVVNLQKNVFSKGFNAGRVTVKGEVISYAWWAGDYTFLPELQSDVSNYQFYQRNVAGNLDNAGINYDALLSIGVESKDTKHGVIYGADFKLWVPVVEGRVFDNKFLNRGVKVFITSPYGELSVGYQEGVESSMKIDAFDIAAGDTSNSWTRYIKYFYTPNADFVGNIPFYFSSGLYSENLFYNNGKSSIKEGESNKRDFTNNLPFRITYKSPNFMGIRFGISYSPLGYRDSLFESGLLKTVPILEDIKDLRIPNGTLITKSSSGNSSSQVMHLGPVKLEYEKSMRDVAVPVIDQDFIGASYKNIISGGISYSYKIDDMKLDASIIGEYAKPKAVYDIHKVYHHFMEPYDLTGIATGINIEYSQVKLGASYGYLGKSGHIRKISEYSDYQIAPNIEDNSYYWNVGVGYKFNDFSISATYFRSNFDNIMYDDDNVNGFNLLEDFSFGFDYSLYSSSKTRCKIFSNYHYFTLSQSIGDESYKHSGYVVLSGIKFDF